MHVEVQPVLDCSCARLNRAGGEPASIQVDVAMRPCDHRERNPGRFPERLCFVSLTLFEEVAAVTMPGQVTICRYEPEGLPEHCARPFGHLAGGTFENPSKDVRSFSCPVGKLTDVASKEKKGKYENAQTVLVLTGGGARWDSRGVLNEVHEISRCFRPDPYIAGSGRLQRCLVRSGS